MAQQTKAIKKKKKKLIKMLKRAYKGSDAYLLEQSQILCDLFDDDMADFEAFDNTFADPFAADWQAGITAAVNYKDGSTVTAEVQEKTDEVKVRMQACRDKYIDIMYYAEKAFGRTNHILKQFGKGKKYSEAFKVQSRMFNFMDELHQAAEKHKVKLIAKGCTQTIIDSIATVRDEFNTGNRSQNELKSDRPEISQGRVQTYNSLFSFTEQVIKAAKSVYRTNPAKLSQYQYSPPVNHRNPTTGERLVIFSVNPYQTNTVTAIIYRADLQFTFTNTGPSQLTFGLTNDQLNYTGGAYSLAPGDTMQHLLSDFGAPGNYLMVHNDGNLPGSGTVSWQPPATDEETPPRP